MNIRELTLFEWNDFVLNHPLGSIYQTTNYAMLKTALGYNYEMIGLEDENKQIIAGALILYKKIHNIYYGYAPRGFLVNYNDENMLKLFTDKIKDYYYEKDFVFIKINPEIVISKYNKKTKEYDKNDNIFISKILEKCGYIKLKDNLNFESLLPRFNAILPFNDFSPNFFSKNTRNKIKKGYIKGLTLEKVDSSSIDIFYDLVKNKITKENNYFKDQYIAFHQKDFIDLFLLKIDYNQFLVNSQIRYDKELQRNNFLNENIIYNSSSKNLNAKMNSDKALLSYKNDIAEASKYINENKIDYIAGALVYKYKNRIYLDLTGFNESYKRFAPNYYLHYAVINYYNNSQYKFIDLNGVSADKESKYYGLTRFKLGFNATIYEYIGEFDLVIMEKEYNNLIKKGLLSKEFNK